MVEQIGDGLLLNLLKEIRTEQRDQRTLLLQSVEYSRRIERRLDALDRRTGELRDDLELMIKAELMGRLGHFEIQIEHALGRMSDRLDAMEVRHGA